MSKPVIEYRHVTAAYGKEAVLRDFSLDISEGECLAVIGHSGCGKTTALKLVNGLLTCREGQVLVFGQDVGLLNKKQKIMLRRKIGYVIQGVGLFPHMSILKNMTYVSDLQKEDKEKARQRALELMELVELDRNLLQRYPHELSGGQKQRVGLIRALVFDPQILLMDEPFGAVDEITRENLQDTLKDVHKTLGKTILFITHDIDEALLLGNRVLVMKEGQIEQCAPAHELLKSPATPYVKTLLGRRIAKKLSLG